MYFRSMSIRFLSLIFLVCLWSACATDTASDQTNELDDLHAALEDSPQLVTNPTTPAEVFQNWQIYMDHNQFDQASQWSTPETQEWISFMQAMIEAADAADDKVESRLQGIQCQEKGDTAICLFAEEAGDALRLDSIRLIKQGGMWKVDLWTEDERGAK